MIEEVCSDIFRIEIPLPNSPLKSVNSYLIKSKDHFLVVDTGWNREECFNSMLSALDELRVDLAKTDFFVSHLHADHIGLVPKLYRKGNKVYFGEVEASVTMDLQRAGKERFEKLYKDYLAHGFPEAELLKAVEGHPGYNFGITDLIEIHTVNEGDRVKVGDYSFICIETPGHSPGHMCLYEDREKILISGDHILFDITSNIMRWPEMENSLGEYLASLQKVYNLDVDIVLPGHRSIKNNHRRRIVELLKHHEIRISEALQALELGEKTAWEVAPHLSWDINETSWERFPAIQKWFAFGETIAHLHYLEATKKVIRDETKGKRIFSVNKTFSLKS